MDEIKQSEKGSCSYIKGQKLKTEKKKEKKSPKEENKIKSIRKEMRESIKEVELPRQKRKPVTSGRVHRCKRSEDPINARCMLNINS